MKFTQIDKAEYVEFVYKNQQDKKIKDNETIGNQITYECEINNKKKI